MSRRIDIELTSKSSDESWTWRAAGAKQPKGVLDGSLVPEGSAVGAVFRADVEVGLADSVAVILSNLAMDEGRKVYFNEIEKMGRGGVPAKKG